MTTDPFTAFEFDADDAGRVLDEALVGADDGELSLRPNDIVVVDSSGDGGADGWLSGHIEGADDMRPRLFPGNYVAPA